MTLYVIRHGQTQWNLEQRYQGQQDAPLTNLGRRQAQAVARRLKKVAFDHIFASPLGRAWTTAGFLKEETGIAPIADDRLMEVRYGECEGLTEGEIEAKFPGKMEWRNADKWTRRLPGAECYGDMHERARSFATEHLDGALDEGGPTIATVGHAGINTTLVGMLMGWDRQETMLYFQPNNVVFVLQAGGIERIEVDAG